MNNANHELFFLKKALNLPALVICLLVYNAVVAVTLRYGFIFGTFSQKLMLLRQEECRGKKKETHVYIFLTALDDFHLQILPIYQH